MNIFITGVSEGIGRELVKLLVRNGHNVWGVARRKDLLQTLEKEVGKDRFFHTVCDVGNESDVEAALRIIKKHSFVPDVIILNAVVFVEDTRPQYNNLFMSRSFAINLFGALTWVEKFLPGFLSRGGGHFIA